MSAILDAFEEMLNAQEEAFGYRVLASVGSTVNKDCIPTDIPSNHSPVAGGNAEVATMQLQMRVSDFSTPPRERFDSTMCKGKRLTVLSFRETGGVYTIDCGDITAEVD